MRTAIPSEQRAVPVAGDSGAALAAGGCRQESLPRPRRVRHRSRSSPSRAVLCPPASRPRSPSASPDRRAHLHTSPSVVPPCAVGSAYYSPRPPAAPLRLVVRGQPAPVSAALDGLASKGVASRRRQIVKRLLRDLVAALPLPAAPAATTKSLTTHASPAVSPDMRDAAVQAMTTSNASDVRRGRDQRQADYKSDGDEWVGGVRALRDSHVRLVLRQLRHIERLNRALDRASRSDIARSDAAALPNAALCALPPAQSAAP